MENTSVVEFKRNRFITEILKEMYLNGELTIASLAQQLQISIPSITVFINELCHSGWITEVGSSVTKSGRRPSLYDLNANKALNLIVDINIHSVNYYVINLKNEVKYHEEELISINDKNLIDVIIDKTKTISNSYSLWAIGVSSTGLLCLESGKNLTYLNHNRNEKSIALVIQEATGISTVNSQNTQASMLGEKHFGLAVDKNDVLLVNLDWGLGLGILSNGQILKGSKGFAGELGHIQVNPNGDTCHCGKVGCLEAQASGSSLLKNIHKSLAEGKFSTLKSIPKESIGFDDIYDAANNGDELAIDKIIEMGRELGKGISIAVHLFNPEIIIIDGGIAKTGDLIINTLSQSISKYCIAEYKLGLQILTSPMGDKAKIFGMNAFVFDNMIDAGKY